MKVPSWEPSAGALVAFLNANLTALPVDLFTIYLRNGTVLRYCGSDVALTVNGQTYAIGPAIQRTRTKQSVGISVDTMNIDLFADSSVRVGNIGIITSIALGHWDGATVKLDHAFYDPATLQPQGVVPAFHGTVGQIQTERGAAHIEVRSVAELLDVQIPSDLYQPGCKNTVYDAYCKLDPAPRTVAMSIAFTWAPDQFAALVSVAQPGAFSAGIVTMTSGPNNGLSRTIKWAGPGSGGVSFQIVSPFPSPLAVGDTFNARMGCLKTLAMCDFYSNRIHFRGEPFVPAPETVI